ncbi:MAG: LysM peptidoglycan-binding domain-containing protein [Clostridia bacterium]|nr:LysM peptidoglycan-binding domain-containing protein [Clostridia bacterium]
MIIHVVKPNDTVYEIAKQYGISPEWIIQNNSLTDPNRLVVGQTLVIGIPAVTHTAKEGETLFSIAREYHVPVDRLLQNNPFLRGNTVIRPGDSIVIRYESEGNRCITVNGYVYPSVCGEVLDLTLPHLSYITPFSYGFKADGSLVTLADDVIIETARAKGVSPIMLLTTLNTDGNFDNTLSKLLLEDTDMQDYLIGRIIENMQLKGYRVLDVDFEFVFPESRVAYADFIKRIKQAFEPYSYEVWVALAPKASAEQKGLLYEAHDYSLLGDAADRVLLMTYEWGYRYGPNVAVAPINKVRQVVDYALTEIPAKKILLGVPNYGYDFTLPYLSDEAEATIISNAEAIKLAWEKKAAIEYDQTSQAPFFRYHQNGKTHEVWFEDARSLKAKLDLMDEKGLSGIGIWNLMTHFPQSFLMLIPYCIE